MRRVSWDPNILENQPPSLNGESIRNHRSSDSYKRYGHHTEHPSGFFARWKDYLGGIPCWVGLYRWSPQSKQTTVAALTRWFLGHYSQFGCPVTASDLVNRFGIYKRHPWLTNSEVNELVRVWNAYYELCLTNGRNITSFREQLGQDIHKALWPSD